MLQGGQRSAVDGVHRQQRNLAEQPRLAVLLDEVHAHAARKEHVGGVGLRIRQRRQFHRVVGLVDLREHFVGDLALVEALEAGHGVLAGLVVGGKQVDLLEAHLVGHFAAALVALGIVPGRGKEIRRTVLAGQVGRARVGPHQEHAGGGHRPHHGQHHVGIHHAGNDGHLVALHQLARGLHAHLGLELVVFLDDLHRHAAQLAAALFHGQHEAVQLVLPQHRAGAGQCGQQADLHLGHRGSGEGQAQAQAQDRGGGQRGGAFHGVFP
ncbi:hypothetical protein D3C72_1240910 [compost metagenome]